MMQSRISILNQPTSLLKAIIICLDQLLRQSSSHESNSLFNLKAQPTISLADYLTRMYKYMNCSMSVFVYALILIDRVQEYNPDFVVNKRNIHRLLLAANLLSVKYLDDIYYKNSYYANIGGVTVKLLNELELQLMQMVNWDVYVRKQTFEAYLERLEGFIEMNNKAEQFKQNLENKYEKSGDLLKNKNQISSIKQSLINPDTSSTEDLTHNAKEKLPSKLQEN